MNAKFNVWLEEDGNVIISLWRIRLLAAIGETGSISSAAAQLDVPYRIAWQRLNEMETRLGRQLVVTQTGGRDGGGSQLTPLAQAYIAQFQLVSQEINTLLQTHLSTLIAPPPTA
ncbi:MAG: winged helix-turn-helix domain-containing protein [Ardenticatenaceae bacterium]|nr:winged helix-turn-helix domain-containing protein [Ardenticatenaceae bacterium]